MKKSSLWNLAIGSMFLVYSAVANSVTLTVTHWGSGMYGAPFAVALEKGFFEEEGLDVTGFLTSQGGGTTVRNAMASEIPYGEVALSAAIAAAKSGVDLTIVHGGVVSLADLIWVTNKGSSVQSLQDVKGKKLGYSSPKSVTDMVSTIALTEAGIFNDVARTTVGGLGSALTALRENAVDVIYMLEPVMSKEHDTLAIAFKSSDVIPQMTQTVGIVRTDYMKKNPDVVKAIINARRKGVQFLKSNPEEAGAILGRQYNLPQEIAESAVRNVSADSTPYWSTGKLDYAGMNTMVKGLRLVKALDESEFEWSSLVDESFLPEEEQSR